MKAVFRHEEEMAAGGVITALTFSFGCLTVHGRGRPLHAPAFLSHLRSLVLGLPPAPE
jgi:hypothetical protein